MKLVLVALALVAAAAAYPAEEQQVIQVVRSEYDQKPDGGYIYGFETENGIKQQETGEIKEALDEDNKPHQVVAVRGVYSYVDPDGKLQEVKYVADENGFVAEGDSIPKPPSPSRR